jgi:hypothetical protein
LSFFQIECVWPFAFGPGWSIHYNTIRPQSAALLLKSSRQDNGWIQVSGGIECDEADARQGPIPQGKIPSNQDIVLANVLSGIKGCQQRQSGLPYLKKCDQRWMKAAKEKNARRRDK